MGRRSDADAERPEPTLGERVFSAVIRGLYSLGLPESYRVGLPASLRPRPAYLPPSQRRARQPVPSQTLPGPTFLGTGAGLVDGATPRFDIERALEGERGDFDYDDPEDADKYWEGVDDETRYQRDEMVRQVEADRARRDQQEAAAEAQAERRYRDFEYTRGGGPRRGRAVTDANRSILGRVLQDLSDVSLDIADGLPKRAPRPSRRGPRRRRGAPRRAPPRRTAPPKVPPNAPPRTPPGRTPPKAPPAPNTRPSPWIVPRAPQGDPLSDSLLVLMPEWTKVFYDWMHPVRPPTGGPPTRGTSRVPQPKPPVATIDFPAPSDLPIPSRDLPASEPIYTPEIVPGQVSSPAMPNPVYAPSSSPSSSSLPSKLAMPSLQPLLQQLLFQQPSSRPRRAPRPLTPQPEPDLTPRQQPGLGFASTPAPSSDPCAVRAREAKRRQRKRREKCTKFKYKRIRVCQSSSGTRRSRPTPRTTTS